MNEMKIFENAEFGEVRTVIRDGEPWFVGKDVAVILGYSNPQKAIRVHVDSDDKGMSVLDTPGGKQEITVINESGLYSLILSSKLPTAKKFKRWVTSEVLPTIRQTGEYKLVRKPDSYMIENPAERARRWAEEYEEKRALEMKIEQDKPLVEFAEHIQTSEDCISMNDMAKLASKNGVKIGRNKLFALLRDKNILQKNNIPYQKYIEVQPWFEVKESVYETASFKRICLTTMVTPQGQKGIVRLLKKENKTACCVKAG